MKENFPSFFERLTRSARSWRAPLPTEQETQRLADDVLRGLRQLAPDPAIWWTPLARRMALVAVVVAFVTLGFQREESPSPAVGPESLASAFLAHSLNPVNHRSHE